MYSTVKRKVKMPLVALLIFGLSAFLLLQFPCAVLASELAVEAMEMTRTTPEIMEAATQSGAVTGDRPTVTLGDVTTPEENQEENCVICLEPVKKSELFSFRAVESRLLYYSHP